MILTEPRRYMREVFAWQGIGWLCRFGAFWFFLPSIPLFLILPALLRANVGFWLSMAIGVAATLALYALWFWAAPRLGIRL